MKQVNYIVRRIWNGWICRENAPNSVEHYSSSLGKLVDYLIADEVAKIDRLALSEEGQAKLHGIESGFLFEMNGFSDIETQQPDTARGLKDEAIHRPIAQDHK
jgi:hypothetical protein